MPELNINAQLEAINAHLAKQDKAMEDHRAEVSGALKKIQATLYDRDGLVDEKDERDKREKAKKDFLKGIFKTGVQGIIWTIAAIIATRGWSKVSDLESKVDSLQKSPAEQHQVHGDNSPPETQEP